LKADEIRGKTMSENLKNLKLQKVINAKRHNVFEAWTKPEWLKKWIGPGALTIPFASVDLQVGSSYRIDMQGDMYGQCVNVIHVGTYRAIIPGELLSFTWGIQNDPAPETIVTIELKDVSGGTEMTFTHEGFATVEVCDMHQLGWSDVFEKLANVASDELPKASLLVAFSWMWLL
jgi:uncharacterized protein YndB with AHSA1/START domain